MSTSSTQQVVRIAVAASLALAAGIAQAAEAPDTGAVAVVTKGLGLELGGQVRLRGELDARDLSADTPVDDAISSRVRFQLGVQPTETVRAFVQIQDVRVFGEETNTLFDADADGLDLHQGYLAVSDFFGSGVELLAGRQELNLGEQRLVGAVDWTQNARSFDGLVAKRALGESADLLLFGFTLAELDAVAAGGALRQLDPAVDEGKSDDAWFVGAHGKVGAGPVTVEPHLYFLRNGAAELERWTLGAYAHGSIPLDDGLSIFGNATFDYQLGDEGDADIGAFLAVAHVGVAVGGVRVDLGYEYLSGDDDLTDGDSADFDTLFATNHKFYGHMDYFLVSGNTARLGLTDLVATVTVPIVDGTGAGFAFHWLTTAETDDARLAGEDQLGQEIDLWLTHRYDAALAFRLGYSVMFPGDALTARFEGADAAAEREPVERDDVAHWAYLQADLSF